MTSRFPNSCRADRRPQTRSTPSMPPTSSSRPSGRAAPEKAPPAKSPAVTRTSKARVSSIQASLRTLKLRMTAAALTIMAMAPASAAIASAARWGNFTTSSAARCPSIPKRRRRARRAPRAIQRVAWGRTSAVPRKRRSAPISPCPPIHAGPAVPSAASASVPSPRPKLRRNRSDDRMVRAPWRSISTGVTAMACRAGKAAARTVASVPRSRAPATVRGRSVISPTSTMTAAWFTAAAVIRMRKSASAAPPAIPAADAAIPRIAHSPRTAAPIWPRVAPTARRHPISRIRSITETETEL